MSNELGFVAPSGRGLGSVSQTGSSRDTSQAKFDKTALLFADMPTSFPAARTTGASSALVLHGSVAPDKSTALVRAGDAVPAGSVRVPSAPEIIASGVHQYSKPRRRGETVVQRHVGWSATPAFIQVTTIERTLRKDGAAFRPAGEWELVRRVTYDGAHGPASRRTGVVPSDARAEQSGQPVQQRPSASAPVDEAVELANNALQFVPSSVRATVETAVPSPMFTSGNIYRYEGGKYTVEVVRMDAARAVVLNAILEPGETNWKVEQATYDLGPTRVEGAQ